MTTDIFKVLDAGDKLSGFGFIAEGAGFANKIKLIILMGPKAEKFIGFNVLFSNETPGFGSKISEDFFNDQFIGAPAGKLELAKTGDSKVIDAQIVAITGATVSSDAVINIFNTYIDSIKKKLQEKGLVN